MLAMSTFVSPQIFLVSLLAGWLNQEQQKLLEYLQEENPVVSKNTNALKTRVPGRTDGLEESSARHCLSQSQCRVGWFPRISRTPQGFEISAPFEFSDTTREGNHRVSPAVPCSSQGK